MNGMFLIAMDGWNHQALAQANQRELELERNLEGLGQKCLALEDDVNQARAQVRSLQRSLDSETDAVCS